MLITTGGKISPQTSSDDKYREVTNLKTSFKVYTALVSRLQLRFPFKMVFENYI